MNGMFSVFRAGIFGLMIALAAPLAAQTRTQAEVNAALRADPQIWGGLFALATAREIGDRCAPAGSNLVEARRLRGQGHVLSLYNRARGLGYSRAEITAFVDDEGEKANLRRRVTEWFAQQGLREGSAAAGFCELGRAEIARSTLTGSFLRAR